MRIHFYKYHGTGNDFIIIDNRSLLINHQNTEWIKKLCHRRFGIGADGLMLLKSSAGYDFEMDYYNSDGSGGTMCGNGGRCIAAFAKHLGIIAKSGNFLASDGPHDVYIDENDLVKLKMLSVNKIDQFENYYYLYTGSPHYVSFVDDVDSVDVFGEGKKIRYDEKFKPGGTNVNFASIKDNLLYIRTYERGVEAETYSCGTGSVASAIAYYLAYNLNQTTINLKTLGGNLQVSFDCIDYKFENVYLKGPAVIVFQGDIEIDS